ncbi:MlaD family protein [Nocardia spumae]|uniref:MlaD family protein n=1 Tax=Nocardia spumae TaxID=2887190 RepID=UPI001D145AAC|nr:MlaD family protein [Nocardia spumae]
MRLTVTHRRTRRPRVRLRTTLTAMVAATVVSTAGCAFDPASIPVPGTGTTGATIPIHIQFANALNLPARAKVMANGARVGTVTGVSVVDPAESPSHRGYVVVNADIDKSVQLPANTTAQLRQDTVLGDIHIELATPAEGFGKTLGSGATIALDHTTPPTQVEDMLAGIATFVQGGAVTRFQDIVDQLNAALPADPRETARIAQVIGGDAKDLAGNLEQVDQLLQGLTDTATTVDRNGDTLGALLTDPAVQQISDSVSSIVNVVGVLGALGGVAHSLVWLAPLAQAGDAAARAFVPLAFTSHPLDLSAPSNLNALVALIRDRIIPFVERGPKVNIVGATITAGTSPPMSTEDQVGRITDTLRMIGAVR